MENKYAAVEKLIKFGEKLVSPYVETSNEEVCEAIPELRELLDNDKRLEAENRRLNDKLRDGRLALLSIAQTSGMSEAFKEFAIQRAQELV